MEMNQSCYMRGRVGTDLELKHTELKGTPVININLGVSAGKNDEGRRTEWVDVAVYGQKAVEMVGEIKKGDMIVVGGNVEINTFQNKDKKQISKIRMTAFEVQKIIRSFVTQEIEVNK